MIFVVLLALLVSTAAGGLAITSHAEAQISGAHLRSATLTYAAESLLHEVEAAATQVPDWSEMPTRWLGGTVVDDPQLDRRTDVLNRSLSGQLPAGANTPRWRVTAFDRDVHGEGVVWVRDDPADGDDNPARDSNGRVTWRVEWRSPRGDQRVFEMTLQRSDHDDEVVIRRVAWRELS